MCIATACVLYTHLYLGMVRGNTIAGQPKWHRKLLIHVDHCILLLAQKTRSSVEPRRPRAHNGDTNGPVHRSGIAAERA